MIKLRTLMYLYEYMIQTCIEYNLIITHKNQIHIRYKLF